ncbi:MAG TPA: acyl-homoserine-lactone synthase [Nitrospirota bacterium]
MKIIEKKDELKKSFLLRHKIFAEELGWVERNWDCLEIDDYDDESVPFGVFDISENLCSYMRVISGGKTFMLEKEFGFLINSDHSLRKSPDTCELSRLCVDPAARNMTIKGNFGIHSTTVLLLKGIYRWCMENGVRFLYAVTDEKVGRLYRAKGFPFIPVGTPVVMPDGVKAVALLMDWEEFERINIQKKPEFYKWFREFGSAN